jgi:hypothetical protein
MNHQKYKKPRLTLLERLIAWALQAPRRTTVGPVTVMEAKLKDSGTTKVRIYE